MFWKREEMVSVADHKAALDELKTKNEERENALCEELNSTRYEYKKAELMVDMAKKSVIICGSLVGVALASAGINIYEAYKGE